MAKEIEHKFLVNAASDIHHLEKYPRSRLTQGYLAFADGDQGEVRVRLKEDAAGNQKGYLTVKSSGGLVREEVETEIGAAAVQALLPACQGNLIIKDRYRIPADRPGLDFEVDVYHGPLAGLVTAELEVPDVDTLISCPSWIAATVTEDKRYKNASLAKHGIPVSAPRFKI